MSDRRKFIKSIAGALVASAMPKSLLNDKPKVKFHEPKPTTGILAYVEKHGTSINYEEIAKEMRVKKFSERLEKAIWAGSINHDFKK